MWINKTRVVKLMCKPAYQPLDDAMYKWFIQLCSNKLSMRGVEIQAAAERLVS